MKILVTGASGFVGGNVARALALRHEVSTPSHQELDLADTAGVDRYFLDRRFDAVVHAAVKGGPAVLEDTLRMQANLLRNSQRFGRFIYFGSGAEYDKSRDITLVGEPSFGERVPVDAYGLAKYWCNLQARASRDCVNLRLFGVYGPGEGYLFKFISNAVVKTLLGLPIRIRQNVRFSYLWIEDLAAIVERFLDGPLEYADFNVTPDEAVSLDEVADLVRRAAGAAVDVSFDVPGMNLEYTARNTRLREVVPEARFTAMGTGIALLVDFYRRSLDSLDVDAIRRDDYALRIRVRD